jgi:hypothetical protein
MKSFTTTQKTILLAGLIAMFMLVSACTEDTTPPPTEYENDYNIMDTLKGEWELVRITSGFSGHGQELTYKQVIKIISQNQDLSINYETWTNDILVKSGTFLVGDASKMLIGKLISSDILDNGCNLLNIAILDDSVVSLVLSMEACDSFYYHFHKISNIIGGNNE